MGLVVGAGTVTSERREEYPVVLTDT